VGGSRARLRLGLGYYVFTDRGGDRIERARSARAATCRGGGRYDIFASASTLAAFVKERNPRRIGVNMSDEIGPADGLSHTMFAASGKTLGEPYASRLVSAENACQRLPLAPRRLRDRRVRRSRGHRDPARRARALERGHHRPARPRSKTSRGGCRIACSSAGSVRVRHAVDLRHRPEGIVATSSPRLIQPGDVMMIDWGVQLMNFGTDVKRVAYVLEAGRAGAAEEHPGGVRQGDRRARRS
jgi:hypothetical protein